jgi:iron complex transport system substrate-binding protein
MVNSVTTIIKRLTAISLLAAVLVGGFVLTAEARPFTDSDGRTVDVPERVAKVWPAGPPSEALVYVLAPDKLMGWSRPFSDEAKAFFRPDIAALPVLGRLTGRGNTASLETVMKAAPDLILDVGSLTPTYVSLADRVQGETHIPYVLLGGSLAETPALLRQAAAAMSVPQQGETLARYTEDALTLVKERIAKVPAAERPKAYMARGARGLQTDVRGSLNAEIFDLLGAQNVVPPGASGGNLADVSLEQVLAWQPDVIVTIDKNFFATVRSDANWQSVNAVRENLVYLEPLYPFGWIDEPPGVNRIIGLRWLAKLLYPAIFPEDLRAETKRFYELFYHQTPSDAQLDQLLGSAR